MEKFQCELEDEHPSLDGSVRKSEDAVSGASRVTMDLDLLNTRYQRLCEDTRDRVKMIGDQHQDDPEIQVSCHSMSTNIYCNLTPFPSLASWITRMFAPFSR